MKTKHFLFFIPLSLAILITSCKTTQKAKKTPKEEGKLLKVEDMEKELPKNLTEICKKYSFALSKCYEYGAKNKTCKNVGKNTKEISNLISGIHKANASEKSKKYGEDLISKNCYYVCNQGIKYGNQKDRNYAEKILYENCIRKVFERRAKNQ